MQYQEISSTVESLLGLLSRAKQEVPDHVEDMLTDTADKVLTMLEALERTWDIGAAE